MLDILWMNHLENLEALRESVGMRAYGQKEPLVEYRRESYIMFKEMIANFEEWLRQTRINTDEKTDKHGLNPVKIENSKLKVENFHNKVGRNDPCPCGSGKKYKKCHGK